MLRVKKIHILSTMVMAVAFVQPNAHAAGGGCKNLGEQDCTENPTCVWVSSYKMKTGKWIEGYCRVDYRNRAPAYNPSDEEVPAHTADHKWRIHHFHCYPTALVYGRHHGRLTRYYLPCRSRPRSRRSGIRVE